MKNMDFKKLKKTCDLYHNFFVDFFDEEIEDTVREYSLDRNFFLSLKPYVSHKLELDENWINYCVVQYAYSVIFTRTGNFKKYIKNSFINSLPEHYREILEVFRKNPFFFSLFSVDEVYDDNFMLISDLCTGEEMILQSNTVGNLIRERSTLFLCLLYFNGDCFQTIGIIHHYKGFIPEDFFYFARMLEPVIEDMSEIPELIERRPIPFLLLLYYGKNPPVTTEGQIQGMYGTTWESEPPNRVLYKKQCTIQQKKQVTKYKLKSYGEAPHFASFYYDERREELTVFAFTMKGFSKAIELLSAEFDLDPEPEYACTIHMYHATREIIGKDFPMLALSTMFDEKSEPDPEQEEVIGKLNMMMKEVLDALNNGRDYDLDEIARRVGVEPEMAREFASGIIEKFAPPPSLEGGIDGFTPPSPAVRLLFESSFLKSRFFDFNMSAKARELIGKVIDSLKKSGRYSDGDLKPETFAANIMRTYEKEWESVDQKLLNYTVYLLAKNGTEPLPVSAYAREVVNLYGHILLESFTVEEALEFEDYYIEMMFSRVFAVFGLIDIVLTDQAQDITIISSSLFREWIRLKESL